MRLDRLIEAMAATGREIPMVGGPADGVMHRLAPDGRVMSAIEWESPPDLLADLGESFGVRAPPERALYLHTVAVRRDPHPCVRGLEMIAEWDAYVWDRVDHTTITVTDQAALGTPIRFRVQVVDPVRYAPVLPTSNEPIRYSNHGTGAAVDLRADLETVRDRWREADRRRRRGEIGS